MTEHDTKRFRSDWFSYNIPIWLEIFKPPINNEIHILEIGSYEGRSTIWFLENILLHPSSTITCIDTFQGSDEHPDYLKLNIYDNFIHNINNFKNKVKILIGKSFDILKTLPTQEVYDVIYVDGSHYSHNVLEDAILSFYLLKKNGYMIFDDYLWRDTTSLENPKIGIDAFLECYKGQYTLTNSNYQLIIQKNL
jgi:predicted O-methyltransferase YrrM